MYFAWGWGQNGSIQLSSGMLKVFVPLARGNGPTGGTAQTLEEVTDIGKER
jgi:hypothetical protein